MAQKPNVPIRLDTTYHPTPAVWDSGATDDGNQVQQLLNDGTLTPKPTPNE